MKAHDIVIVGAGISGAVLAERYAAAGREVLVIDKRSHVGGNCSDFVDKGTGLLISRYGAHLFHTHSPEVWAYVNRFVEWQRYEHRVVARVDGMFVPVPVNITTVNMLFDLALTTAEDMQQFLATVQIPCSKPKDGRQAALALVGEVLYERIFRSYTKKQWDKYPEELDPSVLQRIPIRTNFDDRYFTDPYQALPIGGYQALFKNMLDSPRITVQLGTDFFDHVRELSSCQRLFYTGRIDQYFNDQRMESRTSLPVTENLEYRSLRFEFERLPVESFQTHAVINYPDPAFDFTRIVEYKHIGCQESDSTMICREYSSADGEPYYPVPNPHNRRIYETYRRAADRIPELHMVGRLANYKYFNMDEAFKNALSLYDRLEHGFLL